MRGLTHDFAAFGIQIDTDVNTAVLPVQLSPRLRKRITGNHHLFFQQGFLTRMSFTAGHIKFNAIERIRGFFHTHFQRRGTANQTFCPRRIAFTRQFDHDAIETLLLHHRLGRTHRVHTVVQNFNILFDRLIFHLINGLLGQTDRDAVAIRRDHIIGRTLFAQNRRTRLFCRSGTIKVHDQLFAVFLGTLQRDFFVFEQGVETVLHRVQFFLNRVRHFHFEQEMHAATQVQTERYGFSANRRHPVRRRRNGAVRQRVCR